MPVPHSSPWLRFQSPLIEPDMQFSRIRLSDEIKRRAVAAGLPASTCCHTFRATGITAYLSNGGTLEHAQRIAGHASPKTTKLYDRTADRIARDPLPSDEPIRTLSTNPLGRGNRASPHAA